MRWYGWNFPFFGNCAWLYTAHWVLRAREYFEVGGLKDQSVPSQGVAMAPFNIPLLKPFA